MTSPSPTLLDMRAVAEAKDLLGAKFTEILNYFLEDSQDYLRSIQDSLAQGSIEAMILPAHSLKSSARQMGAIQLSEIAKKIEAHAKAGEPAEILAELLRQLQESLTHTQAAFANLPH